MWFPVCESCELLRAVYLVCPCAVLNTAELLFEGEVISRTVSTRCFTISFSEAAPVPCMACEDRLCAARPVKLCPTLAAQVEEGSQNRI